MFLGSPGSGKSFFARQLAKRIHAVRLNGDSMRIAMFGSVEEIEKRKANKDTGQVFKAIDYVITQILATNISVVYDAHHNRKAIREGLEKLAEEHGATPVVIWIKTPYEEALKRGQEREATQDQRKKTEENMRDLIARHMANFEEPTKNEKVIVIDGMVDFETQYKSYLEQIACL